MNGELGLQLRCHINKNGEQDRFVGIKSDDGKIVACFPLGYNLSEKDDDIRNDVIQLIAVLSAFSETKDQLLVAANNNYHKSHKFPISAYITMIRLYLEQQCYYSEREKVRRIGDKGKIDWAVTLKRNVSFYQKNGAPFFDNYTIKGSTPNENNMVTSIHKFCVYEAFKTIGWIFSPYVPQNPHIKLNKDLFLAVLKKKRTSIFNDNDKVLFEAMISMLDFLGEDNSEKDYYFGTDRFEYVWEKLIDKIFGRADKDEYFPKTKWRLTYGKVKDNHALEPDTIMMVENEIYVLDAKYYRYGVTGIPTHMPESSSIHKQITYGEYVYKKEKYEMKHGKDGPVYNAFLMPYNMRKNPFVDYALHEFENVGEATSEWKDETKGYKYEHVQGIVIDTRFLINCYCRSHANVVIDLANAIKEACDANAKKRINSTNI